MTIRPYEPASDAQAALDLWERALGGAYPVSRRVFLSRIGDGAPSWDWGDTVCAEEGGRLVGLASLELPRCVSGHGGEAYVSVVIVDPTASRRGIGTNMLECLENRAGAEGCTTIRVGQSQLRFFTGVPEDLPAAVAFFKKNGYTSSRLAPDMIIDCRDGSMQARYQERLQTIGARVECCTENVLPAMVGLGPDAWQHAMVRMAASGDMANILGVFRGDQVIGSILTYTPESRFRSACLVWERIFGPRLGGYGEVFVSPAWRGQGLGAAMCEAAALHVRQHGADRCFIGWVGPQEFYRKIGATVWRRHELCSKTLSCGAGTAEDSSDTSAGTSGRNTRGCSCRCGRRSP
ncbi:MAG: GNAT family N-acetyltransferase [Kiritimatiellae bacterium]|nr:GNAT family N-acetyltransferase [Kiritimatiellia bacterium]